MIINSFPKIVKNILEGLPKNDYPVLNSRLFVECWLAYALDNSLRSMRDLFKRLNNTGFDVDISTFSKANTHRSQKVFQKIYQQLNKLVQNKVHKKLHDKYAICPIDSTIITLTSKLLWVLGHHQVKLFSSLNLSTGIVRIKNNWKLEFGSETGLIKIGSSKDAPVYRMINFCDLETKTEFRLVTNLPADGEAAVTDNEIRDIYRLRWGVELLWKFLKMHLKLDRLITKNVNGIAIQIYASLIAYLILQLVSVPKEWGEKMLDKFRYLQACMCQQISYVL
ncbi:transposase [Aphanizomenon flos-aquae NRERC-008]|uniref:transposase n=1 Tax=Aphanizomenon flos-aquae TaxID=1176 RepID=UPI00287E7CA2|nr:transposase [Aphanizomenon flos-aquae]MDS9398662.1 transposase [Aphanizomenon flos-aquae NRERC-008]